MNMFGRFRRVVGFPVTEQKYIILFLAALVNVTDDFIDNILLVVVPEFSQTAAVF